MNNTDFQNKKSSENVKISSELLIRKDRIKKNPLEISNNNINTADENNITDNIEESSIIKPNNNPISEDNSNRYESFYQSNNILENNIENPNEVNHKNHVFYNESALTPPNKKTNTIIILIFVLLVVLLLVGIIGLALSVQKTIEIKYSEKNSVSNSENYKNSIEDFLSSIFDEDDENSFDIQENEIWDLVDDTLSDYKESKIFYTDPSYKFMIGIPNGYHIYSDGNYTERDAVSGVIFNIQDEERNIINISAEYKMFGDADTEYETIKNRSINYNEIDGLFKTELGNAKVIKSEYINEIAEVSAVIAMNYPGRGVVIIGVSSADDISVFEKDDFIVDLLSGLDYSITENL